MQEVTIGIIGCGSISDAYLKGGARSKLVKVKSVADMRADVAKAKAETYGVQAATVDSLLADPDIEIVINLTVPLAHAGVSTQILDAGKHAYSEKPLSASYADAKAMMAKAVGKGLSVGCAPDTFMGASHQAARRAIDEGRIGDVVAGAATVMGRGMEMWHPNPEFFFKFGGGPVHDIGPYYLTQLVNLLGPIERVAAQASKGSKTRTVTSQPNNGQIIQVEVPTTVNGVLAFKSGANVSISCSWDVWKHGRLPFELYGSKGTMLVPDPNFFGGEVQVSVEGGEYESIDTVDHPFGAANRDTRAGSAVADYRMIGLIDMACALRAKRPYRASGALALHVLEVMDALVNSSAEGRYITIETPVERPAPVPLGMGEEVFLEG